MHRSGVICRCVQRGINSRGLVLPNLVNLSESICTPSVDKGGFNGWNIICSKIETMGRCCWGQEIDIAMKRNQKLRLPPSHHTPVSFHPARVLIIKSFCILTSHRHRFLANNKHLITNTWPAFYTSCFNRRQPAFIQNTGAPKNKMVNRCTQQCF